MTDADAAGAVIFSDLVGFTDFNGARGDAAAVEVLDRHRGLMDGALTDGGGGECRVVKEIGDGLLVWSGSARAGLSVATGFLSRLADAREHDGFPLAARVGMHFGVVQPRGDDIVGHTVNVAARIVDLAGPGELVLSDEVAVACGDRNAFALEPVGPAHVKGVTAPVWLHRIEIALPADARCD